MYLNIRKERQKKMHFFFTLLKLLLLMKTIVGDDKLKALYLFSL